MTIFRNKKKTLKSTLKIPLKSGFLKQRWYVGTNEKRSNSNKLDRQKIKKNVFQRSDTKSPYKNPVTFYPINSLERWNVGTLPLIIFYSFLKKIKKNKGLGVFLSERILAKKCSNLVKSTLEHPTTLEHFWRKFLSRVCA